MVALAVGTTSAVLGRASTSAALVAARSQAVSAGGAFSGADANNDPAPQRMIPRPSPDPTPPPPPPPPAAPAAPAAAAAAAPAPARQAPAPAIVVGSTQQALINQDRARNGLGPLTWNGCLLNIARSNAARMAAQGAISHAGGANADLSCGLGQQGGENVGYWSGGVNETQLNTMFMNSAGHRANILGPYHYVGTAWAVGANGNAYIAVEFS